VLTEGDPRELEALARELDTLLTTIASRSGTGDTTRVALLACLHLADENRRTRARLTGLSELLTTIDG
jgi:cell division protein ZapA (FtsZ GTPase activity inhibitor)